MKRYKFRLEQVLRVRQIQQDQAAALVGMARRDLEQAGRDVEASLAYYRDKAPVGGSLSHTDFVQARTGYELAAGFVTAAQVRQQEAAQVVDQRVGEWARAAQRVKGLERLDDHRRTEHAHEAAIEAEGLVDDIVNSRTRRGGRQGVR